MLKRYAIAVGLSALLGGGWAIAQGPGTGKEAAKPAEGHRGEGDHGDRPDLFRAVDTDNEGTISKAELDAFFDKADVDKDGTVTRDEIHKAVVKAWADRLEAMDTNHDGLITRAEWRGSKEMFDRLDPDNDGSISRDEIRAAANRFHEEHGHGDRHQDGDRHPGRGGERKEGRDRHESKGAEQPKD